MIHELLLSAQFLQSKSVYTSRVALLAYAKDYNIVFKLSENKNVADVISAVQAFDRSSCEYFCRFRSHIEVHNI